MKNKEYENNYSESGLWKKLAEYAKKAGKHLVENVLRLYYAMKLGKVNAAQITMIVGALGYFISPIDAIPDFLPGGLLDDAGILTTTINAISACSDKEVIAATKKQIAKWF